VQSGIEHPFFPFNSAFKLILWMLEGEGMMTPCILAICLVASQPGFADSDVGMDSSRRPGISPGIVAPIVDVCTGNTEHFTSNAAITSSDISFDGRCIIVDACTVTIDGVHSFANLSVINGGVVTHSAGGTIIPPNTTPTGMDLTITHIATIDATSVISVLGRGYAPLAGPGAGSLCNFTSGPGHGGAGTPDITGCHAGGVTYDSVVQPTELGSGSYNARGGGTVRLSVAGTLTVDGTVSADGAASPDYAGGAGGTLRLSCATLAGNGSITANGGDRGNVVNAAGSGGGRVAIIYGTSLFPAGNIRARGGNGYIRGGAGTVHIKPGTARATIYVDNAGTTGWTTEFYGPQSFDANLVVRSGGYIGPRVGQSGPDLSLTGNITIMADGQISASKRGYAPLSGPAPGNFCSWTSGPGHGGAGAPELGGCDPGGVCYDSLTQPVDMGSGGYDARGGGAIHLSAGGTLTVDGPLSADGAASASYAGGAGGSLWLSCSTAGGSGLITANGGDRGTEANAGGAGGGRIALYYTSSSIPLTNIRARGGSGYLRGGAGTIYLKPTDTLATIYVDNGGSSGWSTEFYGTTSFDADLIVSGGGMVSPRMAQAGFDMTLTGDITVASNGQISADNRGFGPTSGPGAGGNCLASGGGSYGGAGGFGLDGCPPGATYGSNTNPTQLGSGGGDGGRGGGALRLTTGGAITVDGAISANGETPTTWSGGSGGSIWLTCANLTGSGLIRANGGSRGSAATAGGGGGGRIAIYVGCDVGFPAQNVQVNGGLGWQNGSPGTIYWPGPMRGDLNSSGMVDLNDLNLFVQVLLGIDTLPCHVGTADMTGDGATNGGDMAGFIDALIGG
jgi:hypothetical protein